MKYKYLHKVSCLMLAACLVFTNAEVLWAAETEALVKESGTQTEIGAQPTTETGKDNLKPEENLPEIMESESELTGSAGLEKETEIPLSDKPMETEKTPESEVIPGIEVFQTDEQKRAVDNQNEGNIVHNAKDGAVQEDHSDSAATYVSNIVAGNGVYLEELQQGYNLSFAEGFSAVMDEIEKNYCAFLEEPEDFLAENWQDVLAVYVMKYRQERRRGKITLNAACKAELEQVFFMMNLRSNSAMLRKLETIRQHEKQERSETAEIPVMEEWTSERIRDRKESYPLTVEDYIALYGVSKEEKKILEKYTSTKCTQLCAIVTAAKGFVREQAGTGVSEERIAIVTAACSLIGKVGYFWGGKSYAYAWDERWGSPTTVSAAGSQSSGTVRPFGLDCSGFVEWAYYNGLNGENAGIGNHTSTQWDASEMVRIRRVQPGDMVFYRPGDVGSDNHVGIVIGTQDDGSLLVVHCSSGQNGVVVGEAWTSGFQYVRSPINLR